MVTSFGQKFIVDGQIITPVGKNILLRTAWIIEPDDERPRFITAYPAGGKP